MLDRVADQFVADERSDGVEEPLVAQKAERGLAENEHDVQPNGDVRRLRVEKAEPPVEGRIGIEPRQLALVRQRARPPVDPFGHLRDHRREVFVRQHALGDQHAVFAERGHLVCAKSHDLLLCLPVATSIEYGLVPRF